MNKRNVIISIILAAIGVAVIFIPVFLPGVTGDQITAYLIYPVVLLVVAGISLLFYRSRLRSVIQGINKTVILSCPVKPDPKVFKQNLIHLVKNFLILLAVLVLLLTLILFNAGFPITLICVSVGFVLVIIALTLYIVTVRYYANGGDGRMILCHTYFAYCGRGYSLNGITTAIYKVELQGDQLTLGLTEKDKCSDFVITLPESEIERAQNFINDLERHFQQQEQQERQEQQELSDQKDKGDI